MDVAALSETSPQLPASATLVRELPTLDVSIYLIPDLPPGRPCWWVVERGGLVVETAHSELLALAKIQIRSLNQLSTSLRSAAEAPAAPPLRRVRPQAHPRRRASDRSEPQ